MMKALKMGFLGLAMGVIGAVAFPAHEAAADEPAQYFGCCSDCNPKFQQCLNSAGNNQSKIALCTANRTYCESRCVRTC